jgi:hypothetical protein
VPLNGSTLGASQPLILDERTSLGWRGQRRWVFEVGDDHALVRAYRRSARRYGRLSGSRVHSYFQARGLRRRLIICFYGRRKDSFR